MSIFKLLTISTLGVMLSLGASAQTDGWQIGGGQNSGKGYRIGDVNKSNTTTSSQSNTTSSYYGNRVPKQTTTSRTPIKSQSDIDLFNGGHIDAPLGFSLGYVNKDWRTNFGSRVFHENFWGQEDKRLHGIQLGFTFQPCLKMGLGIHTGLFYEIYLSNASAVKDMNWDSFQEHNFYIPLHLMYRLPITRTIALHIYGGIGLNWAFRGEYRVLDGVTYGTDFGWNGLFSTHRYENRHYQYGSQVYGKDGWPRRLNLQGELGAALRFSQFQIQFMYSWGMTNHHFYDNFDPDKGKNEEGFNPKNYNTYQNKLSISFGYMTNLAF